MRLQQIESLIEAGNNQLVKDMREMARRLQAEQEKNSTLEARLSRLEGLLLEQGSKSTPAPVRLYQGGRKAV